jgi:hypothetical protein
MSTITPVTSEPQAVEPALSVTRLNVVRAGYLFMAIGLTLKKWPLIIHAADRPLYESVTICMLIAMSLLAWLGLRYPVKMLPILIFESAWKLLWLSVVALPLAVTDDLDPTTSEVVVNCSLVVVVMAVIPWRYVWGTYVRAPGDRWR